MTSHHRRQLHRQSNQKSYIDEYISRLAKKLAKLILRASITTSAVLIAQLLYVVWKTPRLPPPPLSGVDFVTEGRVVAPNHNGDLVDTNYTDLQQKKKQNEFRIVLIGDSPVEGIGNTHHHLALSGETARAFAQKEVTTDKGDCYDCVRYWSYGKSGLTAREIEEEMVPYLHLVQKSLMQEDNEDDNEPDEMIHAIVLLCGVNNVLDAKSTASSFYSDVLSLIHSIRNNPRLSSTPLIVLGLPDFSKLPFLPWPLAFVLGYRGRKMQSMLQKAVKEVQLKDREGYMNKGRVRIVLKEIPDVQTVLGTIGYHRCDGNDSTLQMKLCHPLLEYLGGIRLTQDKIASLGMTDFLCDDGFHPGRLGTTYVGNLIREAYEELMAK